MREGGALAVTDRTSGGAPRHLRILFDVGAVGDVTDGQLLERFTNRTGSASELAFAALVERHGPLVLGTCRAVLGRSPEADDAFQATFLTLVHKADALWIHDSLGPWLYRVAHRIALRTRRRSVRRLQHERRAAEARADQTEPAPDTPMALEHQAILDEEVARLPESQRAVVVLCDLQGRTHEQAARHLRCPVGTVKSRQTRARRTLRARLERRGIGAPSVVPLTPAMIEAVRVTVPSSLIQSTIGHATRVIADRVLAGTVPALIGRLAGGGLYMLTTHKIQTFLFLTLGAVVTWNGGLGLGSTDPDDEDAPKDGAIAVVVPDEPSQEKPPAPEDETATDRSQTYRVTSQRVAAGLYRERGVVVPPKEVVIYSMIEGTTTLLTILPEGSTVTKGDLLGELDTSDLKSQLIEQQLVTNEAESSLQQRQLEQEISERRISEYINCFMYLSDCNTRVGSRSPRPNSDWRRGTWNAYRP